jgi:hypothetical protein
MIRLSALLLILAAPAVAENAKTVECYCTDKSHNRIELGETICLQVDGRMFMAQCQMSLNVPMWREVEKGCLSSGLINTPGDGFTPLLETLPVHAKI